MSLFKQHSEAARASWMWRAWLMGVLALMVGAMAEADPMAKFTTEYDRGDGVENTNRADLWEDQGMVAKGVTPEITGNIPNEVSQAEIPANASAIASQLTTVVETLKANPAYEETLGRVNGTTTNPDTTDYGHDAHYTNLQERAGILEQEMLEEQ